MAINTVHVGAALFVCVLAATSMFFLDYRIERGFEEEVARSTVFSPFGENGHDSSTSERRSYESSLQVHKRAAAGLSNFPCKNLHPAMLCCVPPAIDRSTQQAAGCPKEGAVPVPCFTRPGVVCEGKVRFQTPRHDVCLTSACACVWTVPAV
jgi:hypothetical protein